MGHQNLGHFESLSYVNTFSKANPSSHPGCDVIRRKHQRILNTFDVDELFFIPPKSSK